MSSLIWLLLGFAGFAIYEVTEVKGLDRVLWATLGISFVIFALALVTSEK